MSKLTKYAFNSLYNMSSGISTSKEQAGHGYPFISFSTVYNNYFLPERITDLMNTSEKEQKTYSVKKGDIIITRTSETIDELAMSCVSLKDYPKTTYSGFTKRLRPICENVVYDKYIAFYLRSKLFRKTVTNNAFMTLRASFNEDIFSFLNLYLPQYEEQVKIGDLLFSIEQKIQNNNKIIKELEDMSKTLYDYWFVQFDFPDENGKPYKSSGGKMVYNEELKREIPQGWEVKDLSDIESNIVTGKTPSTSNESNYNGDIPFITIGDIRNNTYITNTVQTLSRIGADSQAKKYLPTDSLCISCIASPGLIGFTTKKSQTNQQINAIIFDKDENKLYLFHALNHYFKYSSGAKLGATFANMNKDDFSTIRIINPTAQCKISFNNALKDTFSNIKLLSIDNQQLTSLRDWLLPMLMNGQAVVE